MLTSEYLAVKRLVILFIVLGVALAVVTAEEIQRPRADGAGADDELPPRARRWPSVRQAAGYQAGANVATEGS